MEAGSGRSSAVLMVQAGAAASLISGRRKRLALAGAAVGLGALLLGLLLLGLGAAVGSVAGSRGACRCRWRAAGRGRGIRVRRPRAGSRSSGRRGRWRQRSCARGWRASGREALSWLRWTPVRLRVRAMEKKAIAAVIASRGCSMVWPMARRLKLKRRAGRAGKGNHVAGAGQQIPRRREPARCRGRWLRPGRIAAACACRSTGSAGGLGEDALQQRRGGLRAMRLQHAEQSRSALRVGQHLAAHIAGRDMAVEDRLVGGRERTVDRVGEHRLTLGASWPGAGAGRLRASELVDLRHFHHLSFYLETTAYFLNLLRVSKLVPASN